MIIIRINGGLGNQMFCYALYKKFVIFNETNKEIYIDINNSCKDHNGYELEKIFNITTNKLDFDRSIYYNDSKNNIIDKIRRNIFGRRKYYFREIEEFKFNDYILRFDNKYLDGYWQSIKYLEGIEMDLKSDFTFKLKLDDKNLMVLDQICLDNSVAVHIRRGDYLEKGTFDIFGKVVTLDYYKKAMEIVEQKVENPIYFVFSNDIKWVKENIKFNYKAIYVDWNNGKDSYKDMQLMSNCKHNIIANSTFSWWGAWLNNNPNKIVIAPKKWINREDINSDEIELFYEDWILL